MKRRESRRAIDTDAGRKRGGSDLDRSDAKQHKSSNDAAMSVLAQQLAERRKYVEFTQKTLSSLPSEGNEAIKSIRVQLSYEIKRLADYADLNEKVLKMLEPPKASQDELDLSRVSSARLEGPHLLDLEVDIYLNEFLNAFGDPELLGKLFRAYLAHNGVENLKSNMIPEWPLFDKDFYLEHIGVEYINQEIRSFYTKQPRLERTWPHYLCRLYFAVYDAIRVCHYNTIIAMQQNQWAIYIQNNHGATRASKVYDISKRDFNDPRIIEPLKRALQGLVVKHVRESGLEPLDFYFNDKVSQAILQRSRNDTSDGGSVLESTPDEVLRCRGASFPPLASSVRKSVYVTVQHISYGKLYTPSSRFSAWMDAFQDDFVRSGDSNYTEKEKVNRKVVPYTGHFQQSERYFTILSNFYTGVLQFSPLQSSYDVGSMVLNKIEPTQNISYTGLFEVVFPYVKSRFYDDVEVEDDLQEYHNDSVYALTSHVNYKLTDLPYNF